MARKYLPLDPNSSHVSSNPAAIAQIFRAFGLMALLFSMATALPLLGQTNYGTINGTVTDSSGADLTGAHVTATNTATNVSQTTTTGTGGTYSFVNLNPDPYTVSVSNTGFTSSTRSGVDVKIGGSTRVDFALTVGDVAQTVTVSADSQSELQTDSSQLGGVIEGRQVLESPLNGRNVNNLLDFVPGVLPGGGTSGNTMANGGSGNFQAGAQTQAIAYGNYQIGGGFSGQSLFFIDGVGSNVPENNVNTLVPTQDAVQEFRVSTNDVSAEFGGFGGGVIQISTKSGGNKFHGSAYEYFRNTVLDSNDWFSNHDGLAKPPLHQNQYGANISGPIRKDKAFFFFSWEHESLISGSVTSATLPTSAELAGDFSQGNDAKSIIYDPLTGLPFPGNKLPADRINAVAQKIVTLETPAESRIAQNPQVLNFFATAPIEGYQTQYNARIDVNATPKDSIFARYTFWNPHNGPSDPFGTDTGAGRTGNYTQEGVLGENHVFSPTTIADLRLAYLENYNFQYPLSEGFNMSSLNSNYGAIQSQSQNTEGLLPGLGIQNYGVGAELSQLYWNNTVYSLSGSVTKIWGRHTVKFGGAWRQVLWTNYGNSQGTGVNSLASFTAASSSPSVTAAGLPAGNGLASFLLNAPSSTGITEVDTWRAFLHPYDFYGTDTFQVNNKLTVNAGIRWEQPGAYSEVNNLDTILQPNAAVNVGGLSAITNPVTGASVPLTGQLAFVDSPQYGSRREEQLHWLLFSPRVGFAYRLNDNTVVRSGYGISYFPAEITADSPSNSPINSAGTNVSNIAPTAATGTTAFVPATLNATVDDPFPASSFPTGLHQPLGRSQTALTQQLGQSISSRIPEQSYGYAQQWNFALERAIDSKTSFTIAYAGAKGTHLVLSQGYTGTGFNLNQLPDKYDSIGSALISKSVQNPFYGQGFAGVLGNPTVPEGYLLLPHPQYTGGVTQTVPRYGDSTYQALQSTFVRRFAHGGIVQAAYTWSKLLSNTDNTSSFEDGQGGLAVVQDYNNLKAEKSVSQQSVPQNLVINYGINLPVGRGEIFGSHLNNITNEVVGGWRITGITTFRSGVPLALQAQADALNTYFGAGPIRPNYTPNCQRELTTSPHSRNTEWFNTSCFTQPGYYSFGNENRVDPQLSSEGLAQFDTSFNKSFIVKDESKLEFDAQFFNIFNHAQFAEPNTTLGSPSFGQVTSQANIPRTIQFALRYSF
jgi:hypothetical protein